MRNAMGADKVRGGGQAEVTRLRRERAELEDRAEEAEGGLAAAQADMETGRKRLEQELATTRTEARRTAEEARLEHSSEVWLLVLSRLAGEVR
jgi:molecular chaperone GrpE (heat shock protein)